MSSSSLCLSSSLQMPDTPPPEESLNSNPPSNPNPNSDFASQIDPSEKSHPSTLEIQNPLPEFLIIDSQKNLDQENLSGDQEKDEQDDHEKEQEQDEQDQEDEEGVNMPISPRFQSLGTKMNYSKRSFSRKRKGKKGSGNKIHDIAIQKKMQVLSEKFKPIPFVPEKVFDFSKHEDSLKKLGLWDFAHVEFDRDIRDELIKLLIVNYVPKNRVSYVNNVRVKVSRADLARALKLPVKKPAGDFEGECFPAEFLVFLEEFVSNWMLLHEGDVWVTPSEVVNWLKLIKEGQPQKLDWAGLIWFMMEKELAQGSDMEDCWYASHFQQLIKDQREDLLKDTSEAVVENQEVVEVALEYEEGGDTKILAVEESFVGEGKSEEPSIELMLGQDCVTQVGKDGASGLGGHEGDPELAHKDSDMALKDGASEMAQKDSEMALKDGDSEMAQKDGDSEMTLKVRDSELAPQDGDFEMAQKDGDSEMAQNDGNSEMDQKYGDSETAQKDGGSEKVQKHGDSDALRKDGDSERAQEDGDSERAQEDGDSEREQEDGDIDMAVRGGDADLVKTNVGDVDEVNNADSMVCLDEAVKVENNGSDEFAKISEEVYRVHVPDFGVQRQWLGNGRNDGCQPFLKPCSMAGDKTFTENAGPHVGGNDVEDEKSEDYGQVQGFKILPKSNMDGMSSVSLMQASETGQLPYASTKFDGRSSLELMSTRVENDMMLDGNSLFNHAGKRGIDFEHDISDHSLNENHKRMRMDGHWDKKTPDFDVCMNQIQQWMEKAKVSHETEKDEAYQRSNMMQQVYSQQVDEKDAEILQLRCKVDELQRRRQADVSRQDRELHLMNNVIHGYRMALKETQRTFAEYRKRCRVPDKPFYRDAGSGGVVKSIMELERERLMKEEEQQKMRHLLEDAFYNCLNNFESKWQHGVVFNLDDIGERLEVAAMELNLLRAKIVNCNTSENVMMSEDVQDGNFENGDPQNDDNHVQSSGTQFEDVQNDDALIKDVQNDDAQFEDVQNGDAQNDQTVDAQIEDVQTGDTQIEDVQTGDVQIEDVQIHDSQIQGTQNEDARDDGAQNDGIKNEEVPNEAPGPSE